MVSIKVTGFAGRDAEKHGKITIISVNAGARINGTKNADGKFEYKGEWYNFVCFDKSLDNINKGDKVTIDGTMEYVNYTAKDGTTKQCVRYIVTGVTKETPSKQRVEQLGDLGTFEKILPLDNVPF